MPFGKGFLRQRLSRLSLRRKKSNISVATKATTTSSVAPNTPTNEDPSTTQTPANPSPTREQSSDTSTPASSSFRGHLKKERSFPASIRTLYNFTQRSGPSSQETLIDDPHTAAQTLPLTATPSQSTVATTRFTATPQPSSLFDSTATGREEALAQYRQEATTAQVYPASSGRLVMEAADRELPSLPPQSERQEDLAYTQTKSHGGSATKEKFAAKAGLFWTKVKVKMWAHREERKAEKVVKKL
ncbi:hypothetical protein LTR62_007531 [Meristemomyces frigidus]|uniref:Uncharacterized protein n=1 Tax=Meristemomyces frigidus TaxID=1508187 RepID=A0AAN7TC00_9PEZI|nr:hypothetical protein LTR62_007531 [Meristemomyces frigidus]